MAFEIICSLATQLCFCHFRKFQVNSLISLSSSRSSRVICMLLRQLVYRIVPICISYRTDLFIVSYRFILYGTNLYVTDSWHTDLYHILLTCIITICFVSYRFVLYCMVLYQFIPYRTDSYHIVPNGWPKGPLRLEHLSIESCLQIKKNSRRVLMVLLPWKCTSN